MALRIYLTAFVVAFCAAFAVAPAGSEIIPGELIVAFRSDVPEAERTDILTAAGADEWEPVGLRLRLKLIETDDVEQALAELRRDPRVEYAEPNYRVAAVNTPNDPELSRLWGLVNTGADGGTADADIDADEAWDTTTGSAGVTVAVIDTGIDFGHPDLAAAQWTNPAESGGGKETNGVDDDGNGYVDDWRGWDFVNDDNNPYDDHGHGTHVAGTIGAVGNNGVGVVGVSWQVKLMALKFLSSGGWGTTADAVEAIRYATAMGAVVTNNSWGGGDFSQALLDAIEEAGEAGSLFVAAAGNDSSNTDGAAHYPSSYEAINVVSVAATTRTDGRASFSNFGAVSVDLGAPGAQIYSTVPGGGYASFNGTSMATPHVAGAAALAKAAFPEATAAGLKALLLRTVEPIAALDGAARSEGRLNVGRAVACAGEPQLWVEAPVEGFDAVPGEPVDVSVLAGACGVPTGVDVTATVGGTEVVLTGDSEGVYTGSFVPAAEGPVALTVTATAGAASDVLSVSGSAQTPPPPPASGGGGGDPGPPPADLALAGSVSPAEVAVGGGVTLHLRVLNDKNFGFGSDVVLDIDWPSGLALISTYADRGPGCGQPAGGTLRCHLDWISRGSPYANVLISAQTTAPGELLMGARVRHAGPEATFADNAIVLRTVVTAPPVEEPVSAPAERVQPARLAKATVVGRQLRLRVVAQRPTTARIVVSRRGKTVVSARRKLRTGATLLRLALPRRLPAGSYRVVVTLGGGQKLAARIRAR